MADHTPADKPDLPALSAEHLASVAVENGEAGAQHLIDDPILYESMVANVRKQMERLEAWARADERRKARAELIAEIIKGGPEVYKWRTAARTRTGTPGPWHLSTEPFTSAPTDVDQIACYEIPKE